MEYHHRSFSRFQPNTSVESARPRLSLSGIEFLHHSRIDYFQPHISQSLRPQCRRLNDTFTDRIASLTVFPRFVTVGRHAESMVVISQLLTQSRPPLLSQKWVNEDFFLHFSSPVLLLRSVFLLFICPWSFSEYRIDNEAHSSFQNEFSTSLPHFSALLLLLAFLAFIRGSL